jgi:hypothetical protein
MANAKPKTKTIDDYLALLRADKRATLEKIRKTIKTAATESGLPPCWSRNLPARL